MRTSTVRTAASAAAVLAALVLGNLATAEDFAPAKSGFHVESTPRRFGRPAVEGYVYNEGLRRLSNVRLRVEVLDADGAVVEEVLGWVFGDLAPGGRGYFVVPVRRAGAAHRVSVLSFDVSGEGA
jgi:hypothetical protein